MKNSCYRFLAALISFTRLPLPYKNLNDTHFTSAINYLPWVGIVIGVLTGAVYWLATLLFPASIAVLMAVVSGILFTGAIHEDGFADCCDGFAASRDKDTVLRIMKDPANGSFATLGLISLLIAKLLLLLHIPQHLQMLALIVMHSAARIQPLLIVASTPHCAQQHSKMSANLQLNLPMLMASCALFAALLLIVLPAMFVLGLIISMAILAICCRALFIARLTGYNGDCLGAAEQLGEVLILCLFVVAFS